MQIKAGQWEGGHSKNATQYYNVVGYLTHKWIGAFVMFITIISLCSTGIAQIVAISTGLYYLDTSISKRWVCCCIHVLCFTLVLTVFPLVCSNVISHSFRGSQHTCDGLLDNADGVEVVLFFCS